MTASVYILNKSHVFSPYDTHALNSAQFFIFFIIISLHYIYVSYAVSVCVCVCASTANLPLSPTCPPACQHASTSHTLTLGRSGSTRDVPAKSSSTSSLDPNTCHTKPWQPATSHYQSYSIYRRYSRPPPTQALSHAPLPSLSVSKHEAAVFFWVENWENM